MHTNPSFIERLSLSPSLEWRYSKVVVARENFPPLKSSDHTRPQSGKRRTQRTGITGRQQKNGQQIYKQRSNQF